MIIVIFIYLYSLPSLSAQPVCLASLPGLSAQPFQPAKPPSLPETLDAKQPGEIRIASETSCAELVRFDRPKAEKSLWTLQSA